MWCDLCQYDVRTAVGHRCPECGQAFDPADLTRIRVQPRQPSAREIRIRWYTVAICMLSGFGSIFIALAVLVMAGLVR